MKSDPKDARPLTLWTALWKHICCRRRYSWRVYALLTLSFLILGLNFWLMNLWSAHLDRLSQKFQVVDHKLDQVYDKYHHPRSPQEQAMLPAEMRNTFNG